MKAYVLSKTGRPSVLRMQEVPEPSPEKHEVKIRTEAIGLNYAEVLSRRGQYSWAPKKPYILGMESTGEVVEVGSEVVGCQVGDKVIAGNQFGSYAEYNCVPQHLAFLAIESLNPEENTALLVSFMTAWVALQKQARLQAGESVLIHAAAGGLGTAAIQLAKAMGCKVYGTASNQGKLDLIKNLGADEAINYKEQDFYKVLKEKVGGVDAVMEVVGGDVFRKSIQLLNPFGRLVVVGYASISFKAWNPWTWWKTWKDAPKVNVMNMAQNNYGISASHVGYLTAIEDLSASMWKELTRFVQDHQIKPHVGKVFDFEEMAEAHAYMESRQSSGKIVIKLNHDSK